MKTRPVNDNIVIDADHVLGVLEFDGLAVAESGSTNLGPIAVSKTAFEQIKAS